MSNSEMEKILTSISSLEGKINERIIKLEERMSERFDKIEANITEMRFFMQGLASSVTNLENRVTGVEGRRNG